MANKKSEYNVIIAVPCSDAEAMRALTAQAIGGAIIGAKGIVSDLVLRRSCDIVSNRTWLVQNALKTEATHILFVDCDMVFPYDLIPTLLAHKKEIVGVEYNKRTFPLEAIGEPLAEKNDTLYEARYAGTGVMLIDLAIFRDPNFGITDEKGGKSPWFNFGRGSEGQLMMGEDVWFCNVARSAGYEIWIDPTVKVTHLGEYAY